MSKVKHSPLPWRKGEPSTTDTIIYGTDNERIARVMRFMNDEGLANAEYIATACNAYPVLTAENQRLRERVEALEGSFRNLLAEVRMCLSLWADRDEPESRFAQGKRETWEKVEQLVEGHSARALLEAKEDKS